MSNFYLFVSVFVFLFVTANADSSRLCLSAEIVYLDDDSAPPLGYFTCEIDQALDSNSLHSSWKCRFNGASELQTLSTKADRIVSDFSTGVLVSLHWMRPSNDLGRFIFGNLNLPVIEGDHYNIYYFKDIPRSIYPIVFTMPDQSHVHMFVKALDYGACSFSRVLTKEPIR